MTFNYSGFFIRDLIYPKILDNTIHDLFLYSNDNPNNLTFPDELQHRHKLTKDDTFLYNYHLTNLTALEVGKQNYNPIRYNHNSNGVNELVSSLSPIIEDMSSDYTYLVEVLMQNDLNKVNLFFALVAWLSIDNFRWHKLPNFSHISEDLSYGLVSEYPDLILPYACFIADINRRVSLELITKDTLNLLDNAARLSIN
jgi:hypothetical protein